MPVLRMAALLPRALFYDPGVRRTELPEKHPLRSAQTRYVDARYNDEYSITKAGLDYLSERVQMLRKLTEEICKERIKGFTA